MMENKVNNADYGFAFEYLICKKYKLNIPKYVRNDLSLAVNEEYTEAIMGVIPLIFENIGLRPIKYLAYSKECDLNGNLITTPHDFMLENGQTFSIKTSRTKSSSFKVAPRVIGQAGYNVLNSYFGEIYGKKIETQQDIKKLFFYNAEKLLPILLEKTFISDYTAYVQMRDENNFTIVAKDRVRRVDFDSSEIEFTRLLDEWSESNSLKYRGVTIAEVQTHKLRTFKFRFLINNILKFVYDCN